MHFLWIEVILGFSLLAYDEDCKHFQNLLVILEALTELLETTLENLVVFVDENFCITTRDALFNLLGLLLGC